MHKREYSQIHNISEPTYLYYCLCFTTIHFLPCTLNCRGPCTQLWTLLGLCAHSCRASIYLSTPSTQTYRHRENIAFINPQHSRSKPKLTSNLRTLLYLYIPMVCRPWVGRLTFYYFTLFLGRQPFDSTHHASHTSRNFYNIITQTYWL